MIPNIIGIGLMALAALYVSVKASVWLSSGQEAGGGAPELDGVIFPPVLFTFGLSFVLKSYVLPTWVYFLIWAALTALLFALMELMHKFGEKSAASRRKRNQN